MNGLGIDFGLMMVTALDSLTGQAINVLLYTILTIHDHGIRSPHLLVRPCAFDSNKVKTPTSTAPNAIAVLLSLVSVDQTIMAIQTRPPAISANAK